MAAMLNEIFEHSGQVATGVLKAVIDAFCPLRNAPKLPKPTVERICQPAWPKQNAAALSAVGGVLSLVSGAAVSRLEKFAQKMPCIVENVAIPDMVLLFRKSPPGKVPIADNLKRIEGVAQLVEQPTFNR